MLLMNPSPVSGWYVTVGVLANKPFAPTVT